MAVIVIALAGGSPRAALAADEALLRVEPALVKAATGGTFTVRLMIDAKVAVSGAQASIEFDPAILQVESVRPDGQFATADIVLPDDQAALVREANGTGRVAQVAAAFLPPAAVGAGPSPFLAIVFRVVGCGETDLRLPVGATDAQLIDGRAAAYGVEVAVSTVDGHVRTCVAPSEVTPTQLDITPVAGGPAGTWPVPLVAGGVLLLLLSVLLGGIGWRTRRRRPEG